MERLLHVVIPKGVPTARDTACVIVAEAIRAAMQAHDPDSKIRVYLRLCERLFPPFDQIRLEVVRSSLLESDSPAPTAVREAIALVSAGFAARFSLDVTHWSVGVLMDNAEARSRALFGFVRKCGEEAASRDLAVLPLSGIPPVCVAPELQRAVCISQRDEDGCTVTFGDSKCVCAMADLMARGCNCGGK
jgi:hypothetical protein